jgi:septal ring factor EnvC (AmiA/AmiB activator)
MSNEDPSTFTQKDLMQHLLHASQHAATREELQTVKHEIVADIDKRFEQVDKRFEQVDKRFEQVDKRFDELKSDIKEQSKRHDRLSWYLFAGMLAIFFKDQLATLLTS